MSFRAVETLKNVALIVSEDTRETSKILSKFSITKQQISYRDQNHERIFGKLYDLLKTGQDLALVSDSGTPLISDPGYKLVRDLIKKNIEVVSIPGPSALISALTVSGLPTDKFCFLGFLPRTSGQRANIIKQYGQLEATVIYYESPYRVVKLVEEIFENLGSREVCLVSELTKLHERVLHGTPDQLLAILKQTPPRGEYVVLVAKAA